MKFKAAFRFTVLALTLAACSKQGGTTNAALPVVSSIKQSLTSAEIPAKLAVSATDTQPAQPEVPAKPANSLVSQVTLNKAAILNRTFNYSASLQFSSVVSADISTSLLALSLGEMPAKFNIMGDQLQLLTDGTINFESDVNHPSRLIYSFQILAETDSTITVEVSTPSPIANTFMFANNDNAAVKTSAQVRYAFLRSMEYSADDQLMLIESSVEMTDGSIGEFMESFRPRELTVAADVKPVFNDPDLNPSAGRYDFLDGGDVYMPKPGQPSVRVKTKVADHWDLRNAQPVKWYVSSNAPDEYLPALQMGVEAWNRYSRAAGMPDLIKFMGKLPDGVKVGDPRYNLIVWDTVQDAGAAYESQNTDPTSGIQSHSMIYIPYAWVNIGQQYWNKFAPDTQSSGDLSAQAIKGMLNGRTFAGRKAPLNCLESAPEMHLALESRDNAAQFAKALLRDVVFHEVGHSFGLAHQFKGSLSFDPDDPSKMFANSIMDYNDYSAETAAYNSETTADGPLLEYDRQIISVLYNGGKDVKDSDPTLPACADDVADSTDRGVDPLCIRYDIGSDVTKQSLEALAALTTANAKHGLLPVFNSKLITDALLGLPKAADVKTSDDMGVAVAKAQTLVAGTVGIYLSASSESFGSLGSSAAKSLKTFKKDVLPDGYVENDMRDRALQALEAAAAMDTFPEVAKAAIVSAKPAMLQYLQGTPYVGGLARGDQQALMDKLSPALDKMLYTDIQTALLSKMRTYFIKAVANTPTAPVGFLQRDGKTIDVELEVMGLLAKLAGEKSGAVERPMAERTAALASLKTYAVSENYQPIAAKVVTDLQSEISNSTDALHREDLRVLLANFTKKDATKTAAN